MPKVKYYPESGISVIPMSHEDFMRFSNPSAKTCMNEKGYMCNNHKGCVFFLREDELQKMLNLPEPVTFQDALTALHQGKHVIRKENYPNGLPYMVIEKGVLCRYGAELKATDVRFTLADTQAEWIILD